MKTLLDIIRELAKVILLVFYWAFPLYMWNTTGNGNFLWLFIVSFVLTCVTLVHYENVTAMGVPHDFTSIEDKIETPNHKRVSVEDLFPKENDDER